MFSRRYLIFPIDVVFMTISYITAHLVRYESLEFLEDQERFFISLGIVIVSRSIIFLYSDIYRSVWAYASIHDLMEIIKVTLISSFVSTTALVLYNRFSQHSRMVPILDTLLLLSLLCLRSFSWRIIRDQYITKNITSGKPTLIIGAGKSGLMLVTEIRRQPELNLKPIGFLDDDPAKLGAHIQGVPVLGPIDQIERFILSYRVEELIITLGALPGKVISNIIQICEAYKIHAKILPSIGEIFAGKKSSFNQLREIRVEDLLGRDPVNLEIESIKSYLKGQVILISGAGGSIGSEICRQVSFFEPEGLILLDSAETALYHIDYELRNSFPNIRYESIVGDVKNLSRLGYIFEQYAPTVVFHCAAYKHVPLMEINPSEAVLNNVMGTKNIADISRLSGVDRFVLISTDKAVNPVNIMGASKRASELYLQHITPNSKTKFITVRFGNVLGSNGSVIPRFKEQIEKGGPVTVTHPDVIRYFMTIPEASQLVLQAGSMGEKGEIFILEMGEPVKILELAEEMIRLSGFQPYKDINIEFTGLRPGEKLYEELLLNLEGIKKTHHPKIKIAASNTNLNQMVFLSKLNQLFSLAKANKNAEIYDLFKEIIPEYQKHIDYISITKKN
ncbi:MAG TPA: nucleoside-diphosphate sugar epimerase/dehydratase [Leptospiraceae bacterium]|nr:nucleoside-diphosphate sugar epimerase/dehydratase [Leptospiraceae bacterium]HMW03886.1 nucleoside-diphosphate sugar epimerase/dehydratase [Leptospiraceae bacterium]HMX32400.1 nucleoside-diphosphate sugar epimerase/dehydratase [Leptospiraceae bacterium]HMY29866.1 nucleoside-diphosphate sugar epimerase/dehydratase [Leptospiraceae bacterium]HMZ62990.1 nucleoside-diphosphate sugar epimerase/dehydratase [Leptospiraceae bacterium]